MPDVVSPFLPVFDLEKKYNKGLRKAELFALTYVTAITLAKKVPRSAIPIKLLTGVTVVPGKGISIHPVAVVITAYAPQPVGVMPPEFYQLPNTMGDPIAVGKSLAEDPSGRALRARFQQDLHDQRVAAEMRARKNVAALPPYQRQFIDDVAAGRLPQAPTAADVLGLKLGDDGSITVRLPGDAGASSGAGGGGFSIGRELENLAALANAELHRAGSLPVIDAGAGDPDASSTVNDIQRLDRFGRLNPPDP